MPYLDPLETSINIVQVWATIPNLKKEEIMP